MSILKGIIFVSAFCLSLWGESGEKSVERTIRHYNEGIIIAGKTGHTDIIKPFVSEKVATKTHLWVMAWQDDNLRMDSNLLNFTITKIFMNKNHSQVKTHEVWSYQYDHPTKKGYYPKKTVIYDMEYSLIRQNGKWIIDDTKVLSEKAAPVQQRDK